MKVKLIPSYSFKIEGEEGHFIVESTWESFAKIVEVSGPGGVGREPRTLVVAWPQNRDIVRRRNGPESPSNLQEPFEVEVYKVEPYDFEDRVKGAEALSRVVVNETPLPPIALETTGRPSLRAART